MTQANQSSKERTSTGHGFSASDWLDVHFGAMQPKYEEMLRWVGLQRGWHVLDAELGEFDSPHHIFNHPDFQYRAIQTVFVGRAP